MSADSLKLLIVDDQQAVRDGLKITIAGMKLGITEYLEAHSGEEALLIASQSQPDIILTDIMMGGMDGLTMAEALRQEILPHAHIVIISAYSQFEFAQKAICLRACSYLLKPVGNAELFQTLSEIKQDILSLRKGSHLKELHEQAYQCMLLYEYLTEKNRQINVGKLYSGAALSQLTFPRIMVILGQAPQRIEPDPCEPLSGYMLHPPYHDASYQYVLCETPGEWIAIVALPGTDANKTRACVESVISRALHDCAVCGVSEQASGLSNLSVLYRHAFLAKENGQFNAERISYYERPYTSSIAAYRHLLLPVLSGDIQEVGRQIDSLFIQFKRDKVGRGDIACIVQGIMSYLCVHIEGLALMLEQAGLEEDALGQCDSLICMKSYLMGIMSIACEKKNRPGGTPDSIYEKIALYINAHFASDLSLSSIAAVFGMNYFYLSSMFKQYFRVNYSEYLMKVRLSKAEELLRTTGLMVYEIAQRVGYNDVKYFCRQFKKMYSATPERYRKEQKLGALSLKQSGDPRNK